MEQTAVYINILIIILELCGFYISFKDFRWRIFIFYTEISNLIALLAALMIVARLPFAPLWRYCAVVMLVMTFLITLFILVPTFENGMKILMLSGNGLFHHLLVPLLSFFSYLFLEAHDSRWYVPVIISLIYGLGMFYLNYLRKMDGPYPFFRVHKLGLKKTIEWIFVLFAIISTIALSVMAIAG